MIVYFNSSVLTLGPANDCTTSAEGFRPWFFGALELLNVDASDPADDSTLLLERSLMLIPRSFGVD